MKLWSIEDNLGVSGYPKVCNNYYKLLQEVVCQHKSSAKRKRVEREILYLLGVCNREVKTLCVLIIRLDLLNRVDFNCQFFQLKFIVCESRIYLTCSQFN